MRSSSGTIPILLRRAKPPADLCRSTCRRSSRRTQSAAAWCTASCARAARAATPRSSSRSAVNAVASARGGAQRMTESAALLADEVLPQKPLRQWVLSLPFALRFLLAIDPKALTQVLGIVYRKISARIVKKARLTYATGATGAVTLIQRFGSALNLNIHFHSGWPSASAVRWNGRASWFEMLRFESRTTLDG